MTDTVKLIIEIPKERELIDKAIWYDVSDFDTEDLAIILTALKNGVPLDDVKALEQEPSREIEDYENEIEDLHKENKTLQIKLENAEDVLRGIKEDLEDARAELRERW